MSLIDSLTALCTFRDGGSFHESSSDEEVVHIRNLGGGGGGPISRRRGASVLCRPVPKKGSKTALLDSSQVMVCVAHVLVLQRTCTMSLHRRIFVFLRIRNKDNEAG